MTCCTPSSPIWTQRLVARLLTLLLVGTATTTGAAPALARGRGRFAERLTRAKWRLVDRLVGKRAVPFVVEHAPAPDPARARVLASEIAVLQRAHEATRGPAWNATGTTHATLSDEVARALGPTRAAKVRSALQLLTAHGERPIETQRYLRNELGRELHVREREQRQQQARAIVAAVSSAPGSAAAAARTIALPRAESHLAHVVGAAQLVAVVDGAAAVTAVQRVLALHPGQSVPSFSGEQIFALASALALDDGGARARLLGRVAGYRGSQLQRMLSALAFVDKAQPSCCRGGSCPTCPFNLGGNRRLKRIRARSNDHRTPVAENRPTGR